MREALNPSFFEEGLSDPHGADDRNTPLVFFYFISPSKLLDVRSGLSGAGADINAPQRIERKEIKEAKEEVGEEAATAPFD